MIEFYMHFTTCTCFYILGRHHESVNSGLRYAAFAFIGVILWPLWWSASAYYGIRRELKEPLE